MKKMAVTRTTEITALADYSAKVPRGEWCLRLLYRSIFYQSEVAPPYSSTGYAASSKPT